MKLRTVLGLFCILTICSCNQQPSKNRLQNEKNSNENLGLQSGLRIENRVNRGTGYTDSKGTDYQLRYIPITITNDNSIAIHLQIDFSKEYDYPIKNSGQKFKVLLLPKVYALDGVKLTKANGSEALIDSLQIEFRNYLENGLDTPYRLDEILEPNEEVIIVIGTQYRPTQDLPNPLPNVLIIQDESANFKECDNLIGQEGTTDSQIALRLKLNFYKGRSIESCTIIPCGQVSYTEN
jgi:hypothetical protein